MADKKILKKERTYFGSYYVFKEEETGKVTIEWEDGAIKQLGHDVEKFILQTVGNSFLHIVDDTEKIVSEENAELWKLSHSIFKERLEKIENKEDIKLALKDVYKKFERYGISPKTASPAINEKTSKLLREAAIKKSDIFKIDKKEEQSSPKTAFPTINGRNSKLLRETTLKNRDIFKAIDKKEVLSSSKIAFPIIDKRTHELLREAAIKNRDIFKIEKEKEEQPKKPELKFDVSMLEFKIHEVYCREDEKEWFDGKDEMAASGVHGEADSSGNMTAGRFAEYALGKFQKGDRKTYNPPIVLSAMDIKKTLAFPKFFHNQLALAEKDAGGFYEYIEELLNGFKSVFEKYILPVLTSAVTGALAGSAVGTAIPGLGTAIGAALGALAGIVVGILIELLKLLFRDEIFGYQPAYEIIQKLTINNGKTEVPRLSNGATSSGRQTARFNEHGASYDVIYSWELK